MANFEDCLAAMRGASNRELSDDEIETLQSLLQARQRKALHDGAIDAQEAAMKAADDLSGDIRQAALIERRNALLNASIKAEKLDWLNTQFKDNPTEGISALLVGVNRAKKGARNSVAAIQKTIRDKIMSGFAHDLEETGNVKLFSSGVMDRDVTRALWALGRPEEASLLRGIPQHAVEIGRVINKWQEYARTTANESGAWIGKEAGYIVRQSHDMLRVRNSGWDAWQTAAMKAFDLPRMMAESGEQNVPALLKSIFDNIASGDHMKPISAVEAQPFKGPANLAKKISQNRVVHFKDADSWFDYNETFGARNLREAVAGGLERSAQQIGLLRQLGTNPGAMVDALRQSIIQEAKRSNNFAISDPLIESVKKHDMYLSAVDGRMNIPSKALWAKRGANIRAWQSMSKLGGMILSQFPDIPVYGSEARYQGRSFLSGMAESMAGLGTNMKTAERRELLSAIGVFHESAVGEIARTGSFEEPGSLTKGQRLFFKLNLGQWWTEKMRDSAAMGMSHHMALQAGKDWESLHPDYQRVLSLYDIDKPQWDVIRQSEQRQIDGRSYIAPDTIGQVGDDAMRAHLESQGKRATDADISSARDSIADKVQTYINDRTGFMQLEPDAKTRAIMLQGTQPGSFLGEFMRYLTQFKSFTGAYMQKIMGRELYGRGFEGNNPLKALAAGNGEALGLVNVVLWSTLFGYGSMLSKSAMRGQSPRLPSADPREDAKLFVAAMAQGGGMGLMGDFLFGQANRQGGGMLSSLAGPALGFALGDIPDLYTSTRDDIIAGKGKVGSLASNGMRVAINNTPYLNLFYTRIALDYLLLYRLQEWMNPGYLARMEQRVKTQNNQTFLLPPSQNATVLGVR